MKELNLVHRASVPEGANGQALPAVVTVHGHKGNENVMAIFERTLPAGVLVVSPRAPLPVEEDSYTWFDADDPLSLDAALAALDEFVASLPEAYPVDPERVLLMGFSQGAAMCFSLLLSAPERAMAVAGLAGFLPAEAQRWATPGRLAGKPVLAFHGARDETVPVELARHAVESLRRAGAQVLFREYPTGHKMTAQAMTDIKTWLAERLAARSHSAES